MLVKGAPDIFVDDKMVWNYDTRTIGVVDVDLKMNDTSMNEQPLRKGLFGKGDSDSCPNYKNFYRNEKTDQLLELNPQVEGLLQTIFDSQTHLKWYSTCIYLLLIPIKCIPAVTIFCSIVRCDLRLYSWNLSGCN